MTTTPVCLGLGLGFLVHELFSAKPGSQQAGPSVGLCPRKATSPADWLARTRRVVGGAEVGEKDSVSHAE